MEERRIRPIALAVFRQEDRILVAEGFDPVKPQTFYRPPGGGIEFGERAEAAMLREVYEELGIRARSVGLVYVAENRFTYAGEPGHEIVFVFEAETEDPGLYALRCVAGMEGDVPFSLVWLSLGVFSRETPLYPDGLHPVLAARTRAGPANGS